MDGRDWLGALLAASKTSRTGAMIRCAFGLERSKLPRFEGPAIITSDAFVFCNFRPSSGKLCEGAFAGTMADVIRNVRGIADHCELDPQERAAFYAKMREWFADDYRPVIIIKYMKDRWF